MSLLLVGMSHRTAPLATLGQVAVPDSDRPGLLAALLTSRYLSEAMVVSTCNRLEVYTDTDDPTAGATDIRAAVAAYSGVGVPELRRLLCVQLPGVGVDGGHPQRPGPRRAGQAGLHDGAPGSPGHWFGVGLW